MNQSDNDKILNDLYQKGHNEQPPTAIDELILQHAKQSNPPSQKRQNLRPWLAAASVALVMPVIWLLVQNKQLLEQATPEPIIEVNKPKPNKEVRKEAKPELTEDFMAAPAPAESKRQANEPVTPAADMAADFMDTQGVEEQEKISVAGNRIKREELETESVKANRELLMNELKAKKKTLKQSNLDPILALELQQFEQYLEQGEFEQATQLLQEMQNREPDFDYSELEQRLADVQAN